MLGGLGGDATCKQRTRAKAAGWGRRLLRTPGSGEESAARCVHTEEPQSMP